jgi:prevent-host-death family protein
MKRLPVSELKAHFSDVLSRVKQGERIGILYGRNRKLVAVISPYTEEHKSERNIGILEGRAEVNFSEDYKLSEEEFLES